MKRLALALTTLAFALLIGMAGGGATVSNRDSDIRLRDLNQQLYPDLDKQISTDGVRQIDWICDGVADCVALP